MASSKEVFVFFSRKGMPFNGLNSKENNYENYQNGLAEMADCSVFKVVGKQIKPFLEQAPIVYPSHLECVDYYLINDGEKQTIAKEILTKKIEEINEKLGISKAKIEEVQKPTKKSK